MKIYVFDLVGKMAHFRKMDTNSSSLSYSFPPRTAVAGLIAGILGMERDSYYEQFSPENCDIAVSVKKPFRKVMQTVNYMFVKSGADLNNSSGHTPIPLELILPGAKEPHLRYRIYFSHQDESINEMVKKRVQQRRYIFPPYLGLTECLGMLEWVGEAEASVEISEDPVQIHSVARMSRLQERTVAIKENARFIREHTTRFFLKGRMIGETDDYIFEQNHQLFAVPKGPFLRIRHVENQENILFL
ncbi:MAG: type I-B CRISPR-associated protein Cas5 [Caldibacillus debilis]|jgi:CRISPR-associated protein Cas5h|uniref:type I-B CRISPR-associated protein Cas5b n=1 Tax=Caldibacillus debilis TaxID=301148 RepID=UPI000E37DAB5|nr:type I-B CRISPR-associated protein Cas5b [Caldibacillus debilis]REJ16207.1 MAG: type I-B CRISPR-associated protein Cas5 [Caldibacillus debilis]